MLEKNNFKIIRQERFDFPVDLIPVNRILRCLLLGTSFIAKLCHIPLEVTLYAKKRIIT